MNSKIRPLDGFVLIKPYVKELKTSGGLILPESTKKMSNYKGTVIRVGKGKFMKNGNRKSVEITEGQNVFFTSYDIQKIKYEKAIYYVISLDDIDAIIEK